MGGMILYQSKYGATKVYADWLAAETGFSLCATKKAKVADLQSCDTIVLGGGIYASGIAGLSFLKKHYATLQDKKILVFCVGASPYDAENLQAVVAHNMTDALAAVPCFYCRGRWDLANMTPIDRKLCQMLQKAVAKKPPESLAVWERALAEAGDSVCDWTDKRYLTPILDALR